MKFREVNMPNETESKPDSTEVEKRKDRTNVVPTEIVMKEYYKLKKRYKKVLDYLKDK